ncbi:hypothetical protein [Streptomyces sp. NPDC047097]|uniref:hypothetical protein n=1 Tax=Streptomyces sp. NPDC047097 TaxID=3155260 RepID=UPI0033C8784D
MAVSTSPRPTAARIAVEGATQRSSAPASAPLTAYPAAGRLGGSTRRSWRSRAGPTTDWQTQASSRAALTAASQGSRVTATTRPKTTGRIARHWAAGLPGSGCSP